MQGAVGPFDRLFSASRGEMNNSVIKGADKGNDPGGNVYIITGCCRCDLDYYRLTWIKSCRRKARSI